MTKIIFAFFIISISICSVYGGSKVNGVTLDVEGLIKDNPIGSEFSELKKYLDERGLKYFVESREDLELRKSPDLDDSVGFILAFTVERAKGEVEGVMVQSMDLIVVKFDASSRITSYSLEKAFK